MDKEEPKPNPALNRIYEHLVALNGWCKSSNPGTTGCFWEIWTVGLAQFVIHSSAHHVDIFVPIDRTNEMDKTLEAITKYAKSVNVEEK